MFCDGSSLRNLDISSFDISKVGDNYRYIFDGNDFSYLKLPAGFPITDSKIPDVVKAANTDRTVIIGKEKLNVYDSTL